MSYEVAVYYFPQWHADPHNEAVKGKGWTEWPSLRNAKPQFPGHEQPKVPLWGEIDEADPKVSEMQINAAADHGITTFIYDWYWDMGNEGPRLQRALEEGYLQAPNRDRLNFCLMWANHRPINRERFDAMTDYIIEKYFHYPNYMKIDGKLYFSIYECHTLIRGLGGIEETAEALADFRRKTKEAGYPDLHLNLVEWGLNESNLGWLLDLSDPTDLKMRPLHGPGAPPEITTAQAGGGGMPIPAANELIRRFGIDSVTSYVWVHSKEPDDFPEADYAQYAAESTAQWDELRDRLDVPYYPNVTQGWDPSPRCDQSKPSVRGSYPNTPILSRNTPEAFQSALAQAKMYIDTNRLQPPMVTIYAWNEWTEGGYLEPDTVHGMGYLEAIRNVFPPQNP